MFSVQNNFWNILQNLIKTKRLGMAEGLNYLQLTSDDIKRALLKVLEDSNYQSNANKWSNKYKDQKETPLERAIWWIEWILRNPDAEYLRSPVLRVGYFAGHSFDIIVFVTVVAFVICFCVMKMLHYIIKMLFKFVRPARPMSKNKME